MEAKKNPKQDVHRQSGKFFLIGLTLSVALAIMAFEWRSEKKNYHLNSSNDPIYDGAFQLKSEVATVEEPKIKQLKRSTISPLVIFVTTSESKLDDDTVSITYAQPSHSISFDSAIAVEPIDSTFIFAEVSPEPEGGLEVFYKFVGKNLKYPKRAQHTNTQGKVFIEFVIDKNGQVTDMKVIKGIGSGCDEEAMRVLALTKWQPGRQRGKPVKVRMTMPLNFVLN